MLCCSWDGARADDAAAFFERRVRPLFIERCYRCHSVGEGAKVEGGLRLDYRGGWEVGGDRGPAIVPGKASESLLIRALRYRDPDLQMPPKKRLRPAEIAVFERWIATGAYDPREEIPGPPKPLTSPAIPPEQETFWAFRPQENPTVPRVGQRDWAREPLDAFLLEHWEGRGALPEAPASLATLTRRLAYSLTGLPPAALGLDKEEGDRPDARTRLVDRLLASPRYGERWGRHWLDVARYADSNGMDENMAYAQAYRYRDYVIDAFNADVPFDQFIIEQLAGDLLGTKEITHKVATGFLSVGPKMLACDDPQKMRMDIVDEQIDTTGRAFLGMTFGCARCHDHKFDPITTRDYYGLAGIFKSTKTLINYNVVAKWHEYDLSPPEERQAHAKIEALGKKADDEKAEESARQAAREQREALIQSTPAPTKVMGVTEDEVGHARVHLRGNYLTLGEETIRQVPAVFHNGRLFTMPEDQSGRLQLAQWIASRDNPLTARVLVNRLWRWHFGKGIVTSTDNFGKLGAAPRHQALLDHLAHELVRGHWSIKRLQRSITSSARYGMSTRKSKGQVAIDVETHLPARHQRQRLDAESLRDSLLSLSGGLDLAMHGQALKDQPGNYVDRSRLDEYLILPRRSVYLPIVRSALYGPFVAFDMADPSAPDGDRRQSVVAPQALYLMNSSQVHRAARRIARNLPVGADDERLGTLYEKLLHRPIRMGEIDRARRFLQAYPGDDSWAALVRVLLASNEFLYLE